MLVKFIAATTQILRLCLHLLLNHNHVDIYIFLLTSTDMYLMLLFSLQNPA
jgi:hypothetical protein